MIDTRYNDRKQMTQLLQLLPTYTEATFVLTSEREVKGMARDFPTTDGSPRRWTVDGWEWFIDADTIERVGIIEVQLKKTSIRLPH